MICPKCGADEKEKKFIGPFCIDCYEFKIKLPKKDLYIEQCVKCKRIRLKGKWQEFSKKDISEYITKKCKGEFDNAKFNIDTNEILFKINIDGKEVEINKRIKFEIKKTMCKDCSRRLGGYYEAIIQLRGNEKKIEKWFKKIPGALKKTYITKIEELKEGINLYVGSYREVQKFMSKYGFKPIVTKKLVGVDQGKRLYRSTFLLRFK